MNENKFQVLVQYGIFNIKEGSDVDIEHDTIDLNMIEKKMPKIIKNGDEMLDLDFLKNDSQILTGDVDKEHDTLNFEFEGLNSKKNAEYV